MRFIVYQALGAFGLLFLAMGTAVPWIISNAMLPVWADAIILFLLGIFFLEVARYLAKKILNRIDKHIKKQELEKKNVAGESPNN